MAEQFKIEGADELLKRMREFAPKLQRRGARRAARRAMTVVRDAARANARQFDDPSTASSIWKLVAVTESSRMSKQVGGVVMRVGVRGGARSSKRRDHPWWWRLIELGTETQPARPWLRPALENNAGTVANRLVAELSKAIDEEAARK